jgi:WD40 repeat protein
VAGSLLMSGSGDGSVKVWAMGAAGPWPCSRTLVGLDDGVTVVAAWEGKVLSGSMDRTIRVWDAGTGALESTLEGHREWVASLVVPVLAQPSSSAPPRAQHPIVRRPIARIISGFSTVAPFSHGDRVAGKGGNHPSPL